MSAYKNFITDLPERCMNLLEHCNIAAKKNNKEVTLLLSVALLSLTIPFERLKNIHPSGDSKKFNKIKENVDHELEKSVKESDLFNEKWLYKKSKTIGGDPDSWELNSSKPIVDTSKKTKSIINILRNALAHGSIWTTKNPIEKLLFVSYISAEKPEKGFDILLCSPDEFSNFMKKWVNVLKDEH